VPITHLVTPLYDFRAFDEAGAVHVGTMSAPDEKAAVERIRRAGLRPIEVTKKRAQVLHTSISVGGSRKVKMAELAVMNRQLATMINSGLPMLRCLGVVETQSKNDTLKKALGELQRSVRGGDSLSVAMEDHPKVFDALAIAMVRAGEESGQLDAVLSQLADTQERAASLRRKLRSAMTYPVAIGLLAGLIVTAMLLFLVPRFEDIFADLGGKLPAPTRAVIALSRGFGRMWWVLALAIALGVFALRAVGRRPRGRRAIDRAKLRVPLFGELIRKIAIARFARSLGVLVRSGAPILEALDIASRTVKNQILIDATADVGLLVRDGNTLARSFGEHKDVFPSMVIHMIEAGEESGRLDTLLDKVADYYESQVDSTISALTSLVEPALLVFMGITVGGMVVSLYLPMFQVLNLVQQQ
jgi:type IV pilus assembly protein PilC